MAIQYADNENYEKLLKEEFVIADFYSETCVPCKMFSVILERLAEEIPFLNIVKINTTKYPELGEKNHISAVPTVLFYKNGQMVEKRLGMMQEEEVKKVISQYLY